MGEIVTIKADQKQARQCYAKSLKVAPYPPTREQSRPHLTIGGNSQVMSMDEGSPIWTLTVYEASLGVQDGVFEMDPCEDTIDKGLKSIEELVKLHLGPKPEQWT